MSEAKIDYADVVEAAKDLMAADKPVNAFRIRVQLGRGGYKTIEKHLDRFRREQNEGSTPSPPAQIAGLWEAALDEARKQLQADRDALEALADEQNARVEQAKAAVQTEISRRELVEQLLQARDEDRLRLETALDYERKQHRNLQESLDVARADLVAATARFSESISTLRDDLHQAHAVLAEQHRSFESRVSEGLSAVVADIQTSISTEIQALRALIATPLEHLGHTALEEVARVSALVRLTSTIDARLVRMEHQNHLQQARDRKARPRLTSPPPKRSRK